MTTTQLFIEVEPIRPDLYADALKSYEMQVKLKDSQPVHIVFNKIRKEYFISTVFKKETWESMKSFIVIK